jgi:hypothetical protein
MLHVLLLHTTAALQAYHQRHADRMHHSHACPLSEKLPDNAALARQDSSTHALLTTYGPAQQSLPVSMSSSPTCSTALLLLLLLLALLLLLPLLLLLALLLLSTRLLKEHTQSRSTTRAAAHMYVADQQNSSNENHGNIIQLCQLVCV